MIIARIIPYLFISQLFLWISACHFEEPPVLKKIKTLVDIETTFNPGSSNIWPEADMLFNLVGGHTGFGDITGPLWIALAVKKQYPKKSIVAVIDDYAYKILQSISNFKYLSELSQSLQIDFISPAQAKRIKKANVIFELFSQARNAEYQINHPFRAKDSILIMSDNMHSLSQDYIEIGDQSRIFFHPPGIGPKRSGIVDDPQIKDIGAKTLIERRMLAATYFKQSEIQSILKRETFPDAKIGFLYGAHNTKDNARQMKQTENYLLTLKEVSSPTNPLIVFSPNTPEVLRHVLQEAMPVYTPDDFEFTTLENKIYLLAIGSIHNTGFLSLLASSDVPIVVEGNNSISAALRLRIPFLAYESNWNGPQIVDFIHLEQTCCSSRFFSDIYTENKGIADFLTYLNNKTNSSSRCNIFNKEVPAFSDKILYLLTLDAKIKSIDSHSEVSEREQLYLNLAAEIRKQTKDTTLEYSFIVDANNRGQVCDTFLAEFENTLKNRLISLEEVQASFTEKPHLMPVKYSE